MLNSFGDDRGDTGKMAGPDGTFQLAAELGNIDHRQHGPRIHVRHIGRKKEINAGLLKQAGITVQIARIASQILAGAELQTD
jgi:hypothetical protein